MADEPEKTPIQRKYAQQYADDLAANRKEQDGITEQIAGLRERLEQLKQEEMWLAHAQGSLPPAEPAAAVAKAPSADKAGQPEPPTPAETVTPVSQTVPSPRQDEPAKAKQPAKKTTAAKKTAARRTTKKATPKAAKKTAAEQTPQPEAVAQQAPAETTAAEEKSGPPLWQLVLDILRKTPGQPCMAREVTDQLAQDHPGRKTTIQTVRNKLEALVRKNLAEKSHRQGSAMYTAYADTEEDAAPAADGGAQQAPEKVSAEA